MIKNYYELTKPGIVWSHTFIALAGLVFATHHHGVNLSLFLHVLCGIALIVASYCVINNVLDRDIDAKMERTKDRSIPKSEISIPHALIFAGALGVLGAAILFFGTNLLTLLVELVGAFFYLALYTPLKRTTVHSTLIGGVSGATPLVAGYVAVTNTLDIAALILFLVMIAWQMVHFFAIATYRLKDYQTANIPVFPVRYGVFVTKIVMLVYAVIFAYATFALYIAGGASVLYAYTTGFASTLWILFCVLGFWVIDDGRWGQKMFFYSLFVLLIFAVMISIN